jgi:hypothetical protein
MVKNIKKYSTISIFSAFIFLLSLRPIVSRDALKLHMAFSDLWKNEGFFFFQRFNARIELGMMNLNYLYALLLRFFGWEQLPKITHGLFLIMTAFAVYFFVKKRFSELYGLWSFVLVLTMPIHIRLASEVYVDLGLLFFSTMCVIYYIRTFENEFSSKCLIISAVFCGLAAGTKYNGFIFSFIVCLMLFLDLSKKISKKEVVKWSAIYISVIIVMISPWLIRNYAGSGNPFYPLFTSIFGSNITEPEVLFVEMKEVKEIVLRQQSGESIFEILMIPLRFFFTGKDNDFLNFDGVLNPFIIFLIPFAFFKPKDPLSKQIKIRLLIIFLFILLFNSYYQSQRIRYVLPFMGPLLILAAAGYYNIVEASKSSKSRYALALMITLPILIFNMKYAFDFVSHNDIVKYLFGGIQKEQYLEKHVPMYKMYNFINSKTPEKSVIYDVLCGNRYFYVKRKYVCSPSNLNWWFFNMTYESCRLHDYLNFLGNLPNTDGLKADYLIVKPDSYIKSFLKIYHNENDSLNLQNTVKLNEFVSFLKKQNMVFSDGDAYLFKIDYNTIRE